MGSAMFGICGTCGSWTIGNTADTQAQDTRRGSPGFRYSTPGFWGGLLAAGFRRRAPAHAPLGTCATRAGTGAFPGSISKQATGAPIPSKNKQFPCHRDFGRFRGAPERVPGQNWPGFRVICFTKEIRAVQATAAAAAVAAAAVAKTDPSPRTLLCENNQGGRRVFHAKNLREIYDLRAGPFSGSCGRLARSATGQNMHGFGETCFVEEIAAVRPAAPPKTMPGDGCARFSKIIRAFAAF
jgi:hypothetical protein